MIKLVIKKFNKFRNQWTQFIEKKCRTIKLLDFENQIIFDYKIINVQKIEQIIKNWLIIYVFEIDVYVQNHANWKFLVDEKIVNYVIAQKRTRFIKFKFNVSQSSFFFLIFNVIFSLNLLLFSLWRVSSFSQILIVFLFAIFINKFYIKNIRLIAKIDIYIYFDFSNFSIHRFYSILNYKIKNVDKKFNELKFKNLSITFLIFLFIENDIITSVTNLLIYDLLIHFIIMNKNRFFRSIIRNIMID